MHARRRRSPARIVLVAVSVVIAATASIAVAACATPGTADEASAEVSAASATSSATTFAPSGRGVPIPGPRGVIEPPIPALPPMTTSAVPTTAAPGEPRVLLVGDSTMLAIRRYGALGSLVGFEAVFEAASCRTLAVPSCGPAPAPPNVLEVIEAADGPFDIVVVMAGYDEWWTSFPTSFDRVVGAARAQGADQILWLTFREGVGYTAPDGSTANEAFVVNNRTLRDKVASGDFDDVVLADWYRYTADPGDWLALDGIHITEPGAFGLADYLSRWIAFLSGRPCPSPPGTAPDTAGRGSCPDPDTTPWPADLAVAAP